MRSLLSRARACACLRVSARARVPPRVPHASLGSVVVLTGTQSDLLSLSLSCVTVERLVVFDGCVHRGLVLALRLQGMHVLEVETTFAEHEAVYTPLRRTQQEWSLDLEQNPETVSV